MKRLALLLLLALGQSSFIYAQAESKVVAAGINTNDIERNNKMIDLLRRKSNRQSAIDTVLANPNAYNPTVTYYLSNVLLKEDKKSDAMFWFYLSQLRARVDANICKDNTANDAVLVLNQNFGPAINKVAFSNIDALKVIVDKVVAFAKANEETYDRRWINLHGVKAATTTIDKNTKPEELSQPVEKWADIKRVTIEDYYNDFIKHVIKKEE